MPHVLLVEDDEHFTRFITALAHEQGYSSSCAQHVA